MSSRTWEVAWVNGWVRDPNGQERAPIWGDRPEYAVAHELVDRWGHDLDLERRLPRIGSSAFWWPLRFVLQRNLARLLPQLRLLDAICDELPAPPDRIVITGAPDAWWPSLFRLVFPRAQVVLRSGGAHGWGETLAYARAFLQRAAASSRRVEAAARPGRGPKVLVVSQDRMWDGNRDRQLHTVIDALAAAGLDPVVLSRPWGDPAHRLMSLRTRPRTHLFADHVLLRHLLRRGYPRPPRLDLPGAGFTDGGRDLGPVVRDVFQGGVQDLYRQRRAFHETMPDLARALNLRAAVVTDENGGSHGIKTGLQHAGVPVVGIQHGVIHEDHLSYIYPRAVDPASVPLCEATCVYGDRYRSLLVERSIYARASVTVTGHVQMDALAGRDRGAGGPALRAEILDGAGDCLLFFTSQGEFRALTAARLLGALARSRPGNRLVIRPHPQEGPPVFWENAIRVHGVTDRAWIRADGSLDDWLTACDVHLSVSSTVLSEAVWFDKPNIVIAARAGGDFCGVLDAGVAVDLDAFDSLDAAVDHWRRPSPPAADEHAARRRHYVQAHFHGGDGRAGDRVAQVVASIAGAAS
jgi:hypothetical protein